MMLLWMTYGMITIASLLSLAVYFIPLVAWAVECYNARQRARMDAEPLAHDRLHRI